MNLNESLFEDVFSDDFQTPVVDELPQTEEDVGYSAMIVESIKMAYELQEYITSLAYLTENEILEESGTDVNSLIGKLTQALQEINPQAEYISQGEEEAEL